MNMKKIFTLISILLLFNFCNVQKKINKYCPTVSQIDSVYIEKKDTIIKLEKDSSTSKIIIKCDSLNKPIIIYREINHGKELKTNLIEKDGVEINQKELLISTTLPQKQLKLQTENKIEKIIITKHVYINKLTKLQNMFIQIGKFFTLLIFLILLYYIIKLFKKLKFPWL